MLDLVVLANALVWKFPHSRVTKLNKTLNTLTYFAIKKLLEKISLFFPRIVVILTFHNGTFRDETLYNCTSYNGTSHNATFH